MKVRHKERGHEASAVKLNPSTVSPAEMILIFEGGEMDSDYVRDWDPADPNLTHADLTKWLDDEERSRIG